MNLWALHHEEKHWENPWLFNPDRFLDESGQLLPGKAGIWKKYVSIYGPIIDLPRTILKLFTNYMYLIRTYHSLQLCTFRSRETSVFRRSSGNKPIIPQYDNTSSEIQVFGSRRISTSWCWSAQFWTRSSSQATRLFYCRKSKAFVRLTKALENPCVASNLETRMQSNRMRTVRCSNRLGDVSNGVYTPLWTEWQTLV